MASSYNQRAAMNAFLSQPGNGAGNAVPEYTRAREVIAFSIPVSDGVLSPSDCRLADINENTSRGKVHGNLLKVFNILVENVCHLAGVLDENSKLASVDMEKITPGTLRVSDFIDQFGRLVRRTYDAQAPAHGNGWHDDDDDIGAGMVVPESSSREDAMILEDPLEVLMMQADAINNMQAPHEDTMGLAHGEEDSGDHYGAAERQAPREPYHATSFVEGLGPREPTADVYIEMVYGCHGDAADKEASALRAESHLKANEDALQRYARDLRRMQSAEDVPPAVVENLEEELHRERLALDGAKQLLRRRKIDAEKAPVGYGQRSDEVLQCVTVWFLTSTLISLWSTLQLLVTAAVTERDASSISNAAYAIRKDFLEEIQRGSGVDAATEENQSISAAISTLLLTRNPSEAAFERMQGADGRDANANAGAASSAVSKLRSAKPRAKTDRLTPDGERLACLMPEVINAMAADYAVSDVERARKSHVFCAGSSVMRRDTNGDLDPTIVFSPVNAIYYHGNNCHPLQSEDAFLRSNGGTYFLGGYDCRCPDGFFYFSPPVPELFTRISPALVKEDFLRQCELPKSRACTAPVIGQCHDRFDKNTLASIHMRGVIPKEAHMEAARFYINNTQRRAAISSVTDSVEHRNGRPVNRSGARRRETAADRMRRNLHARSYARREMDMDSIDDLLKSDRRGADAEHTEGFLSDSVLAFDPRTIMRNKALLQTDPDTQILGSNVLKCVEAVQNFLVRNESLSAVQRNLLMNEVRNWASARLFEAASSKRNNSPSMKAIYHRAAQMANTPPLPARQLTDDLPPISDFLARGCVSVADDFAGTEGYKVVMFWVSGLSCFRADEEAQRRQNMHMMGPGGEGKGVVVRIVQKFCNSFTDDDQQHFSTILFVSYFSEKSFQSGEKAFEYDRSIIVVEELPRNKASNKEEDGGASAVLKNLMTSNRTRAHIMFNDPATSSRVTIHVLNWVRIMFIFSSNGTDTNLEKAWRDRAIGIYIADKEGTCNDISRAMTDGNFKSSSMETKDRQDRTKQEFQEMQAFVALVEDQLAFGGLTPIDTATATGMLAGVFSMLKREGSFRVDNRMIENICSMARSLCIAEFFEAEFKRPMGQFYGKCITAERIRAAEWSLTIKMHHVILALGFYAPLMFPQGQDEFRIGVKSLYNQMVSTICSNNRIDRLENVMLSVAEQSQGTEAERDEELQRSLTRTIDADSTEAIAVVIRGICQVRSNMRDAAKNARTRDEITAAYELDYVVFSENNFISRVSQAIRNNKSVETRPSTTAIQNLRYKLREMTIKARPRKLGTTAAAPLVEDPHMPLQDKPVITNAYRANHICVLHAFLDESVFGMTSVVRAMKRAFNNSSTPPAEYLFTPGVGSSFTKIVLGRGLGPDSKTLADIDVREDPVTGEPVGEVSRAAHRPLVIPNYYQRIAPASVPLQSTPIERLSPEEQSRLSDWTDIARDADAQSAPDGDSGEEEDWSRLASEENTSDRDRDSLRRSAGGGGSSESSSNASRRKRWVDRHSAKNSAHGLLLLCSWDEFARLRRAEKINLAAGRAPLYEARIASSLTRAWAVPSDRSVALNRLEKKFADRIWNSMDKATARRMRASGGRRDAELADAIEDAVGGGADGDDDAWLNEFFQGSNDDDEEGEGNFSDFEAAETAPPKAAERDALLVDLFDEEQLVPTLDSLHADSSEDDAEFGEFGGEEEEEDFDRMADSYDQLSGESFGRGQRPSSASREKHSAAPLPRRLPKNHVVVVRPEDILEDARLDKSRLMVKHNPCYIADGLPSTEMYNPRGEVPIWSLIPDCSGFGDYFLRIYSTPLDYRMRALVADPAYGRRMPYPESIVSVYRSRTAASNTEKLSGTFMVLGGRKLGKRVCSNGGLASNKQRRRLSRSASRSSPSFKGVLSK